MYFTIFSRPNAGKSQAEMIIKLKGSTTAVSGQTEDSVSSHTISTTTTEGTSRK